MKVSFQWLNQYVDVSDLTAEALAERLTQGGIEVDGIEACNLGVDHVVVGEVITKEKHPDAEKLSVCQVDVGAGELLQIVCGASNVAAGQKVPVALVGASLPGDIKIKRAKLRGVESQGMICSAKELGMNEKWIPKEFKEGILVLPKETDKGANVVSLLGLDDRILDLDLTPNRADCLSMLGVAYEVAALLDRSVRLPATHPHQGEGSGNVQATNAKSVGIKIVAEDGCSHYSAGVIEGVTIAASPLWMQQRLVAAGVRPINNVVDITNYVMLEYGQPLHAFDADLLAEEGQRIEIRYAQSGEQLVTLDGQQRKLEPHMLLITDGQQPIALAGVMGGAHSEVTLQTTRILLESARFAGQTVRRTSRELGLRSEASLRFEKEVNPAGVIPALERAISLICQYVGGTSVQEIAQQQLASLQPKTIQLSVQRVNARLGTDLQSAMIAHLLQRLGFDVRENGREMEVTVPLRRGDIVREVDLIEEIARLYGYDRIPTTLVQGVTTPGALTKSQRVERELRKVLTSSGLHEAVTYSLTANERAAGLADLYATPHRIALAMPMSEERSMLRTSLLPHLLEAVSYNRNRNMNDIALFELGKIFLTDEAQLSQLPREQKVLSVVVTGAKQTDQWDTKPVKVDFYDLKGHLDRTLAHIGIVSAQYEAATVEGFHPGRTAEIYILLSNGKRGKMGHMGQIHPALQKRLELEDTYVFELDFAMLADAAQLRAEYQILPRYPASSRDIAVIVDRALPAATIVASIQAQARPLLEAIRVFDIFIDEKLGAHKKSIALALNYRHSERTLTDEEVNTIQLQIIHHLLERYGAELRK
jgi:phenylalanyl-tRNA synthetase beta chain